MSPPLRRALRGLGVGALATVAMDLTAFVGRSLGVLAGASPDWVARWFGLVLRGAPITDDIRLAPDVGIGLPALLAVHYAIGAALGLLYVTLARGREHWASALAFALGTNVLPWLVMFPAMGFGLAGLAGPEDALLFRTSLVNHLGWGVGLVLALQIRARATPTPAAVP
ncbi:MAG: DUF2938 family protein [Sandaracinaceae bacterium]|nr:DUF2938 family protein [Sandaracinaceae bacterium]